MSKAFTREGDDGGLHASATRSRAHAGPITPIGARLARERMAELSARPGGAGGRVGPAGPRGDVGAFGPRVSVRAPEGRERVVVVAPADEIGLVPHAASATSPIARALLGAHAGDVVEFTGPRG